MNKRVVEMPHGPSGEVLLCLLSEGCQIPCRFSDDLYQSVTCHTRGDVQQWVRRTRERRKKEACKKIISTQTKCIQHVLVGCWQ